MSSAITFSTFDEEDGLDKFIAIVMAFNQLPFEDNGILHVLLNGPHFKVNEKVVMRALDRRDMRAVQIQEGNKLEFLESRETHNFTLMLGKLISCEPLLVGRSTVVLHAKMEKWKKLELVVGFSCESSNKQL